MKIYIVILIAVFLMPFVSSAQKCVGVSYNYELPENDGFKKSLSQSFTIQKGESILINQTFFENNEYFISLFGNTNIGKIRFRLLSKDGDENQVLFDNANYNYKLTQNLIIKNTVPLIIEISAPNHDSIHHECLGIQIHFNKHL